MEVRWSLPAIFIANDSQGIEVDDLPFGFLTAVPELNTFTFIIFALGVGLILALADGMSCREIERRLGASAPTVSKWKSRFQQQGIEGLQGRHQGSKPRRATPVVQARVIRRAQQKPSDGSTHWSCRKLSQELGISKSTVQRILAQAKLQPHRLERYMASSDPEFEAKAADIIGLYVNPPQHAAVFCVDEKTAIQALDRLDPVLPLAPSRAERHGLNIIATARYRCMRH
jgi:transposase